MSIRMRFEIRCDGCGRTEPDRDSAQQEGDVLLPDGWVETMVGDHLCRMCTP